METPPLSHESILAELEKILSSSAFTGAERSRTLLKFLVEQTVNDRADHLKEYTIGAEALGKGDSFDPRTDPIVRAEASRLRGRLERYYAVEGQADSVTVVLPKGSYVPRFESRVPQAAAAGPASAGAASARSARRVRLTWFAVGAAAGAATAAIWFSARPTPPAERPLMQFEVELKSRGALGSEVGSDVVLSPDGDRLVFVSRSSDGVARLNTRRLDQTTAKELPGTDGARGPFFSPDGQWVGFWATGSLKKTAIDGGSPVVLCEAADLSGGSWGDDGNIIAALSFGKLSKVPSSSGPSTVLADLMGESIDPRWPQVLPGGRYVLFTAVGPQGPNGARIEVLSLANGMRKILVRGGTYGRYLSGGYLTYVNQGTLFAVPFDLNLMEASPDAAAPVLDDVAYSSTFGFAQLDVSRTGTLVYRRSAARGQLIAAWIDKSGGTELLPMKPGQYTFPRLSPDGQRLALAVTDSGVTNIGIHERQSDRFTRLNSVPGEYSPTWSHDGRMLVVGSRTGLYWMMADGTGRPQLLLKSNTIQVPWSFTPDGTRLAYHELTPSTGFDLWTVPVRASENGLSAGTPERYLQTPAYETYPSFSPDGRWLAYGSGGFARWEVYVRPFPDDGSKGVQVSHGGGRIPRWLPNGRELLYRTDDQRIMVSTYSVKDGVFVVGKPKAWSSTQLADTGVLSNFDLDAEGTRAVGLMPAARPEDQQSPNHVTVALNFPDEVRRRVGRKPK
jgi:Tol biopolymer transport system component